jgi:hypothetical protein
MTLVPDNCLPPDSISTEAKCELLQRVTVSLSI